MLAAAAQPQESTSCPPLSCCDGRNISELPIDKSGSTFSGNCSDVVGVAMDEPEQGASIQSEIDVCECALVEAHCELCPDEDLPDPDRVLDTTAWADMTCRDLECCLMQYSESSESCLGLEELRSLCGCSNSAPQSYYYLGATTITQKKVLVWLPRTSGIVSAVCSLMVVGHIVWTHGDRYSVYHGLVLAMSSYDIAGSIAWAFSAFPIPVHDEFGSPTGVYGAHGSAATCTAQGFFVQLGYTGIFYNLALSIYYLLVIRYGWREERLRKIAVRLHAPPLLFGWGLALGGIPVYENSYWGCWILPDPKSPAFIRSVMFFVVPLLVVLIVASVNMFLVYLAVRRQDRRADKWRISGRRRSVSAPMERAVVWQCLFYLLSLYITWPFMMVAQLLAHRAHYRLWVAIFLLAPSQGVWNCIVYMRPRCLTMLHKQRTSLSNRRGSFSSSRGKASEEKCHEDPSSALEVEPVSADLAEDAAGNP